MVGTKWRTLEAPSTFATINDGGSLLNTFGDCDG